LKLTLTEPEIMRAIQKYLASKVVGTGGNPDDWAVRIRWRGEYAEAEHKAIPTLNDQASPK
jgi:hypothetical protein